MGTVRIPRFQLRTDFVGDSVGLCGWLCRTLSVTLSVRTLTAAVTPAYTGRYSRTTTHGPHIGLSANRKKNNSKRYYRAGRPRLD